MSNKFLQSGDDTDLTSLQDGSFQAYLGSLRVDDTTPNQMVRMNANKELVSTLVEQSDLNFSVLTNPNPSVLVTDGLDIANGNDINFSSGGNLSGATSIEANRFVNNTIGPNEFKRIKTASIEQEVLGVDILQQGTDFQTNDITNIGTVGTVDVNMTGQLTGASLIESNTFVNNTIGPNNFKRIKTASIEQEVLGVDILQQGTDFQTNDVSNIGTLKCGALTCLTFNTEEKSNRISSNANIRMLNNDITEVDQIDVDNITSITNPQVNILKNLDMNANSVVGANDLQTASISALTSTVTFQNNVSLATNNITGVGSLQVDDITINGNSVTSTGFLEFVSGGTDRINFKSAGGILSLENANVGNSVNIELAQFGGTNFNVIKQTGNIDFCAEGADTVELTTDCFGTNKKVILNPNGGGAGVATVQLRDYDLDMNNKNIDNVVDISASRVKCAIIEPPVSAIINTLGSNFINASAYRGTLLDVNEINDLSGSGISVTSEFKMNQNDITNVGNLEVVSVNNLTPVGGVYSGISDGATISSSTFTDLLPTTSVGSLSVPANTFLLGSAFHLVCSGIFPSESKNDDVEIELCAIQGATNIQLGVVRLELENFDTEPSNFELEADFVIRSLGVSAQVAVSFDFTFNKKITSDFKGTRATNLATIDTTQASTLALNARIVGSNGSSIKSTLAYLRKQY